MNTSFYLAVCAIQHSVRKGAQALTQASVVLLVPDLLPP